MDAPLIWMEKQDNVYVPRFKLCKKMDYKLRDATDLISN